MNEEICGACRGPWPCECSERAVPVVRMASVDDDYATALARSMREDKDAPLRISAYVPEPIVKVEIGYGDGHCGHRRSLFELNVDQRIVWCRNCGTVMDPYDVLAALGHFERRLAERLKAAQELERRASEREEQRLARARVRHHRYSAWSREHGGHRDGSCATCRWPKAHEIHAVKGQALRDDD